MENRDPLVSERDVYGGYVFRHISRNGGMTSMALSTQRLLDALSEIREIIDRFLYPERKVTMTAQSRQKLLDALSETQEIIAQISDDDLDRMESLAEEITQVDEEMGGRIAGLHALLVFVREAVLSTLEDLQPATVEEEDVKATKAETKHEEGADERAAKQKG